MSSWFDSLAKAVSEAVEIGTRDLQEFVGTVTEDTTVATQAATQVAASALTAAASAASAAAAVAAAEAERLTSIVDQDHLELSSESGSTTNTASAPIHTNLAESAAASDSISEPANTMVMEETSLPPPDSSLAPPLLTPSKALNAAEIAKERLKKIEAAEEEPLGWGDE